MLNPSRRAAALGLATWLLLAVTVQADDAIRTVRILGDGHPVAGARVSLFDPRHQVVLPVVAVSDEQGLLRIPVPDRNLQLRVEARGYVFWSDIPPAGATPEVTVALPFRRQEVRLEVQQGRRSQPPGVEVPWALETPDGRYAGMQGLLPPSGVTTLVLPDRPFRLHAWLGGGKHTVFLRDGSPVTLQVPLHDVHFELRDAAGEPLPRIEVRVRVAPTGAEADDAVLAVARSDAAGELRLPLVPGDYRMEWRRAGRRLGETTVEVAAGGAPSRRITLALQPWLLRVEASDGGPLEGAEVVLRDERGEVDRQPWQAGDLRWSLAPGSYEGEVQWQGWTLPFEAWQVARSGPGEPVRWAFPVDDFVVEVRHSQTGSGFGAVRVGLGPPGSKIEPGEWTDHAGRLARRLPAAPVVVRARWFGIELEQRTTVPGQARLVLDSTLRRFEPPAPHVEAPLARVRRDDFEAWTTALPGGGFELPLPAGDYTVTVHDSGQRQLLQGRFTAEPGMSEPTVDWGAAAQAPASPAAGAPRRLRWPAALTEPPTVERREGPRWVPVPVAADGQLGPLPEGSELRVPAGGLGRPLRVSGVELRVELGLLEIELPRPGRLRLTDAGDGSRQEVLLCPAVPCVFALPPGHYQIFAPGTELQRDPVEVESGQRSRVRLRSL